VFAVNFVTSVAGEHKVRHYEYTLAGEGASLYIAFMKAKNPLRFIAAASILFLSFACVSKKTVNKTVLSADGSSIVYKTRGKGKTALVFVHCWGCNQKFWKYQVEPFAKDFRVVTLDMAGHGQSKDFKRGQWNVATMAQDVEAVLRELDLKEAVLVGSSMGGPISLQVAADMPDRVRGVACVDTLHDAEKPMPREIFQQMVLKLKADFEKGVEAFIPFMFTDHSDPRLKEWIVSEVKTCDPKACVPLLEGLAQVDLKELMRKVQVPIRCVNSAPYRPDGFKTNREVNRKYADFDAVEMEGVGHFPMLERPDEFNGKLRQAVDSILAIPPRHSATGGNPPN